MHTFYGEYECKLDEKGRVILPSRFKQFMPEAEEGTNRFFLKKGFEPCLVIYHPEMWEVIFRKVSELSEFNMEQRLFQRYFLNGLEEIELDKAGRFLIPKTLQRHAKLEKDMLMIGLGKRIEIWNPDVYMDLLMQDQSKYSQLAQQFLEDAEQESQRANLAQAS